MRSGTPRRAAEAGVRAAVRALAAGRMVVVADDREREDEGDLVAAAALMSAEQMAFFLRHGSGIVCAPMSDERANELELPLMVDQNTESHGTAFTVSVDHRGVGTLHLRGRPGSDRSCAGRSRNTRHRPAAPRGRVPVARPPGRRAQADRAHRGRDRPGDHGGHGRRRRHHRTRRRQRRSALGGPDPCVRRRARPAVPARCGPCLGRAGPAATW